MNSTVHGNGLGDELHLLLEEKGYYVTEGCPCQATIRKMNKGGITWTKRHIDKVIGDMVKEAYKRRIKVFGLTPPAKLLRLQARRWINQAIRRWRQKQLTFS